MESLYSEYLTTGVYMADSKTVMVEIWITVKHWHHKIFEVPVPIPHALDHFDISFIDENKITINFISFEEKEYYHQTQDIPFSIEQQFIIINTIIKKMLTV